MRQSLSISVVCLCTAVALLAGCAATDRSRVARRDPAPFPELTLVEGQRSERGVVLTVSDDLFVEKLELKANAQRDLAALAAYLKDHPRQKLAIEGPTIVAGGDPQRRDLSLRRGATVVAYFLRSGVDPDQVEMRTRRAEASAGPAVRPHARRIKEGESVRSRPAPAGARSSL